MEKYQAITLRNIHEFADIALLDNEQLEAINVVGHVLPFKTNTYVVKHLIDWEKVPHDPIYILNFPQKEMLLPHHYDLMKEALETEDREFIRETAQRIRHELNPHPAGQKKYNVPSIDGVMLPGIQHKYQETVLFFPMQGQTCHAYCSFCFRWAQFTMKDLRFGMKEIDLLVKYLEANPQVTDVLFTGGDPMVMKAKLLDYYITPLVEADLPNLKTIRIGSKTLSYWPYRYTEDEDADEVLSIFESVVDSGYHLAFMAHFNHFQELRPRALHDAVENIRKTGAIIRTQSPLLNHINASSSIWATLWKEQVRLGMIPYYMFVARNTGAQHYFSVPLVKAAEIFRKAYEQVSGVARTVRGPSMSATPGKVEVTGIVEVDGKKAIALRFIQGRNPEWVGKLFFAKYDETATWLDDLIPFRGEQFFFEKELSTYLQSAEKNYEKLRIVSEEEEMSFSSFAT